ncbi:hypothetical protein MLD38_016111 [Melastoma candidum]|uniref:Uncharacterized protein n=1 Tax=Melastoma candidum TaxID=119954 RepID=A0ACB9RHN9_9MYRT|nr:hypothetical protein MLD38_016111 [Melastoma candidum]
MGCVSSKHVVGKQRGSKEARRSSSSAHVVSLTSSTYGVLNLDKHEMSRKQQLRPPAVGDHRPPPSALSSEAEKVESRSPPREEPGPEVINAWELMEGLEEAGPLPLPPSGSNSVKKSPRGFLRGFDSRSPMKFMSQIGSPRKARTYAGKENKESFCKASERSDCTPKEALKSSNSSCKGVKNLRIYTVGAGLGGGRRNSFGSDNGGRGGLSSRRSLSPLFDPELVASYERELSQGEEQIKKMISPSPLSKLRRQRNLRESDAILAAFERKCPPGGEDAVVIYTTTLRGIRKTFEDCNTVRKVMESYNVQLSERDVSMDSGYKEEVKRLMGVTAAKLPIPLVFVKGRLIGGAEEVVKLEEEGKMGVLLDGIPGASAGECEGCAGFRFVMCAKCCGSCKVFDAKERKSVKCGECNENGLIHCPICC